jgi:hypothetical protein
VAIESMPAPGSIPPEPPGAAVPQAAPRKKTWLKLLIVGGACLVLGVPACFAGFGLVFGGGSEVLGGLLVYLGLAGIVIGPILLLVGVIWGLVESRR